MPKSREQFPCPKCHKVLSASVFARHLAKCSSTQHSSLLALRSRWPIRVYKKDSASGLLRREWNAFIKIFLGLLAPEDLLRPPLSPGLQSSTFHARASQLKASRTRRGFDNPIYRSKKSRCLTNDELTSLAKIWYTGGSLQQLWRFLAKELRLYPTLSLQVTLKEHLAFKGCLAKLFGITEQELVSALLKRRESRIRETAHTPEAIEKSKKSSIRAKLEGRGVKRITRLQIALFRELENATPGKWLLETPCPWYNYWTPDIYSNHFRVAIEIDGWWIHGPIEEKDSDYIKKSKKRHHLLDNEKNNYCLKNNTKLLRIWDHSYKETLAPKLCEEIFKVINGAGQYESPSVRVIRPTAGL